MIKYVQNKNIDYKRMDEILKESSMSNHFSNNGPTKNKLEKFLEKKMKIDKEKRVICVANGTLALHGLLLYLSNKGVEKWVSPSLTFPSCVVNTDKVHVEDIQLDTLTVDYDIAMKYDGVIITSLFGTYPRNIQMWNDSPKTVILDVASSPMTEISGKNICNFGNYSFGSLHHTKYLGFGEGGFIVAPKEEYYEIISTLGFGFKLKDTKRIHNPKSSNFKMSDVSAASILQHAERYSLSSHLEIQNEMVEFIKTLNGVKPLLFEDGVVYGNIPLLFDRKVEKDFFLNNGLEVQKYYYPISDHQNSLFIYDRILNLPLHSDLSKSQIEKIKRLLEEFIN